MLKSKKIISKILYLKNKKTNGLINESELNQLNQMIIIHNIDEIDLEIKYKQLIEKRFFIKFGIFIAFIIFILTIYFAMNNNDEKETGK